MDFTEYGSVQRWLRRLTDGTRKIYLQHLRSFCEYAGMTPDQLFEERKKDMQSTDEVVRRRADERLDRWFETLEKKGLARNTCVLAYSAVRSFYAHNYYPLMSRTPRGWIY